MLFEEEKPTKINISLAQQGRQTLNSLMQTDTKIMKKEFLWKYNCRLKLSRLHEGYHKQSWILITILCKTRDYNENSFVKLFFILFDE